MTLPDNLLPVLTRALSIAIEERQRHLSAVERDTERVSRDEARELKTELWNLREAQAVLLSLVLR